MTVAEQVVSVFTGVKGYLDDVDLVKSKLLKKISLIKLNPKARNY